MKDLNKNSNFFWNQSPHFDNSCSYKEDFNSRMFSDLTDKKYVFDDPNFNHLDNIVEKVSAVCMPYFYSFLHNNEYKANLSEKKMEKT